MVKDVKMGIFTTVKIFFSLKTRVQFFTPGSLGLVDERSKGGHSVFVYF
jgi:hypothetical protein